MFALLGSIPLRLISYVRGIGRERAFDYPEQARIGRKPTLQHTGDGLERVKLEVRLHRAHSLPEFELARLRTIAQAHAAVPLVFGNGVYVGRFVIGSMSETTRKTDRTGGLVAIDVGVDLVEDAGDGIVAAIGEAVGVPAGDVAASLPPAVPAAAVNFRDVAAAVVLRR